MLHDISIKKFMLGVIGICLLCGCNTIDVGRDTPTIWFALLTCSEEVLLAAGEQASSYAVLVAIRGLEWFVVLFPVLVSIPGVYEFADSWLSGNYYLTVSRTGRAKYAFRKLLIAGLTGAAVVVLGVLLYTAIVYLKFPALTEFHEDAESSILMLFYGETVWERTQVILHMLWNLAMHGALAAMVSLVLVAVLRDKFLALSIPMMIEYLSTKLSGIYNMYLLEVYGWEQTPPLKAYLPQLFIPSDQLIMETRFEQVYGVSYGYYGLYLLAWAMGLFLLLTWIVKRRNE